MKIGITGHSEFLGKVLFELLSKDNEVHGFSRSNGYDLDKPELILEELVHMDVFINNTYHPTNQKKIFEQLFQIWKNENKTIFNILTSAIFNGGSYDDYRNNKLSIQKSSIDLVNENIEKIEWLIFIQTH